MFDVSMKTDVYVYTIEVDLTYKSAVFLQRYTLTVVPTCLIAT